MSLYQYHRKETFISLLVQIKHVTPFSKIDCIIFLYIPLSSDKTVSQVVVKVMCDSFISLLVQIKPWQKTFVYNVYSTCFAVNV